VLHSNLREELVATIWLRELGSGQSVFVE